MTSTDTESEFLLGIHDFQARSEDEISLAKGDNIRVLETDRAFGDGWYIGHNLRTGQTGLFPKVFTTTILPGDVRNGDRPHQQQRAPYQQPQQPQQQQPLAQPSFKQAAAKSPEDPFTHPVKPSSPNYTSPGASNLTHRPSVHDTLSDIDEAISEINHSAQTRQHQRQGLNSNLNRPSPPAAQPQTQASHRPTASMGALSPAVLNSGLDFDNVAGWSPEDVKSYFLLRGYDASVADQFVRHKITGSILLELELAYLKEIDISSFGTRFEISKEIKNLNAVVHKRNLARTSPAPKTVLSPRPKLTTRTTSLEGRQMDGNANASAQATAPSPGHRREASFDKNWTLPTTNGNSRDPKATQQLGPAANIVIPESSGSELSLSSDAGVSTNPSSSSQDLADFQSHLRPQDPQQPRGGLDRAHKRNSVSAGTYQEFVDMRYRQERHSRNPSYDTVRASIHEMQHSRSLSTSSVNFLDELKRNNNAVSQSQVDVRQQLQQPVNSRAVKRRSTLLSALLGNGGIGSAPSSPRQLDSPGMEYVTSPDIGSPETVGEYNDHDIYGNPTSRGDDSPASAGGYDGEDPDAPTPLTASNEKMDSKLKPSGFGRMKTLRQVSSQANVRQKLTKQATSAFIEGIKHVSPEDAAATSEYSGWMKKRGGVGVGAWKSRFFTLHGTRLSYFTSFNETKERGLIDITAHRVLPARETEDRFVALYAASVGAGRHCFKLVPPAPGSRKGVTFTAPKVHYFAVESREEMRKWMAALMKATIDRDETKPVLTSCVTPTIPLHKAREMFGDARIGDFEELRNKTHANSGDPNGFQMRNGNATRETLSPSPESSLRSSHTGSTNTNASSLRAPSSSATSPNDDTIRHLTTKTAGLKLVTNLEETH